MSDRLTVLISVAIAINSLVHYTARSSNHYVDLRSFDLAFYALTLLVRHQKEHPMSKK